MKRTSPIITALFLIAAVCGCVSPQEQAQQQAYQENQRKEAAAAAERAEHVKQNWAKLHEGLTFDEAEQLVGPFNERTKEMANLAFGVAAAFSTNNPAVPTTVSNSYTVVGENYTLIFESGKLKSWTLK